MAQNKDVIEVRRPAYFWWFLANLLALCFAVTSWLVCLHVFGNPEIPRNYELLRKIGRLPEIKRYTVLDVPNGNLLDAAGLYARFIGMEPPALQSLNSQFVRNYLKNHERPLALTYVEGTYRVMAVRKLDRGDFIRSGMVVRARAMVAPDEFHKAAPYPVLIDYVFPTVSSTSLGAFAAGDLLEVRKSPNCAAILHVDRVEVEGQTMVCATVVPIAYGTYRVGKSDSFEIEPPEEVSPGARFPAFGD